MGSFNRDQINANEMEMLWRVCKAPSPFVANEHVRLGHTCSQGFFLAVLGVGDPRLCWDPVSVDHM